MPVAARSARRRAVLALAVDRGHRRLQLGELATSFNQMTESIEHLLQTEAEKKRLEEELRIAHEIQMSPLPQGPDVLLRAVKRLYNLGIFPEWWKLPPLPRDAWAALDALIAERDPYCRGVVLPGGADWQWLRDDGVLEVDARYVLQDKNGARVQVVSQGLRHGPPDVIAALARGEAVDPSLYYFRTAMRFETAAAELLHLNFVVAIGVGGREARLVRLDVFALA